MADDEFLRDPSVEIFYSHQAIPRLCGCRWLSQRRSVRELFNYFFTLRSFALNFTAKRDALCNYRLMNLTSDLLGLSLKLGRSSGKNEEIISFN